MGRWLVSAPCEYAPWPVEYVVDDDEQHASGFSSADAPEREHSDAIETKPKIP